MKKEMKNEMKNEMKKRNEDPRLEVSFSKSKAPSNISSNQVLSPLSTFSLSPYIQITEISPLIVSLPSELWKSNIVAFLNFSEIKLLRLVCKWFRNYILRFPVWKQKVPIEELEAYVINCDKFQWTLEIFSLVVKDDDDDSISLKHLQTVFTLTHPSSLQYLKSINLSWWNPLSNDQLQYIPDGIESLDLSSCRISDDALKFLPQCLKFLDLSYCFISSKGINLIPTSLTELFLSKCTKIEDVDLVVISKMTKLVTLDLNFCYQISDDGIKHLTSLTNLTSLSLAHLNRITKDGLSFLPTSIQRLNLSSNFSLTDDSLFSLSTFSKLNCLILVSCKYMSLFGLKYIQHLPIVTLDLTGWSQLNSDGFKYFPSTLKSLSLDNCSGVSKTGIEQLYTVTPHLQELNLSNCPEIIDDMFIGIKFPSQLKHLLLRQCSLLTDEALINSISNIPSLKKTDLYFCKLISEKGIQSLVDKGIEVSF